MSYQLIENQWGEVFIEELHRNSFFKQQSSDIYDNELSFILDKRDSLYFAVGSDSGLLIRYLAKTELPKGCRIIIVERDEIFDLVTHQLSDIFDPDTASISTPYSQIIDFYRESDWQAAAFNGNEVDWFRAGEVQILESLACKTDYLQVYLPLFITMKTKIEERRYETYYSTSHQKFIRTQIFNTADNTQAIYRDLDFGRNRTALVIGGGPSVDKHIDWIKANRNKLFVIIVSRVSGKMQKENITPDLVVAIDPIQQSYDVSKEGILWEDVPLVAGYHTAPQITQQWRGPRLYLGRKYPWRTQDGKEDNVIPAVGPTVGHTATMVALQLGFDRVLLSGVDICYDASINTHSKGSPEATFQSIPSLYDAQVETYSGRMAGTHYRLIRSVKPLNQIGNYALEHDQVVYNLNDGAAKIETIEYKSISDISLLIDKPDFNDYLSKYPAPDPRQSINTTEKDLDQARTQLHFIERLSIQALKIIDRIYDGDQEPTKTQSEKLDKIERKIENRAKAYLYCVKHYAAPELTKLTKPSGFEGLDNQEMASWIRGYYTALRDASSSLLEYVAVAEQRVATRRLELSKNIDINALLDQWQSDNTPGRILLLNPRVLSNLNDEDLANIEREKASFLESLENQETYMAETLRNQNTDIDHCMRSLTFLYNVKNTADLSLIVENLQGSDWPGNVLSDFSQALIHDIKDEKTEALNFYQKVIDVCGEKLTQEGFELESMQRLIEESLVKMTHISIDLTDYSTASYTLGTLCEFLPQYIPSFAKLMNLCGNTKEAVELLHQYLENYPSRWQAANVLAEILEKAGRVGEAEEARLLSRTIREKSHLNDKMAA